MPSLALTILMIRAVCAKMTVLKTNGAMQLSVLGQAQANNAQGDYI